MRARGLKQNSAGAWQPAVGVAPHAGAWIETAYRAALSSASLVAPHAGAWIETNLELARERQDDRRAPCGRVD